ncbi:MAG: glycoside hydrolase family 3 C-terminal domain-containing protein [Bacteroidaceae bacterium]|nr:glycoside hydrolase family 3 C-terminal domain-containing protein [Bacteroidaceae bacterium]
MRKTFIRIITCIMVVMAWSGCKNGDKLPYQNESLSIEKRVDDLLDRLTVNEKIDLMRATSPANERLGFPKYYHGNEALHGVVRPGRFTVFPQAIGLAAMWDTELMQNISTVISDEARARWNELEQGANQKEQFSDLLTFWSPTINMARDPRWGRTPETYGEDPFLTGEMGTAFVKGLQGNDKRYLKVVSTPKHFACNNIESNRFEANADISEKQLREYYLPAYEACVRRGGAASIMSAYNSINGIPCTANPWLLTKLLRDEWGFKGYVVSDCGGVHLIQSGHHFVREKLTAATLALKAGLDLECGDDCYIEPLQKAYELGMVSDEDINRAARRVLTARMRLGFFDAPESCPYSKISPDVIGSSEHQQMALQAAREAIVLLKNEGNILPLDKKKIHSLAVVGVNAADCVFGDYSGIPASNPISVLEGIKTLAGKDIEVKYAPWKSARADKEVVAPEFFPEGLTAEYFDSDNMEGTPTVRKEEWINFEPSNQAPDPFVPTAPYCIRWTGKLRPPVTGNYVIRFEAERGGRLYLDGQKVTDVWESHHDGCDTVAIRLEGGRDYNLKAEFQNIRDYSLARLSWKIPTPATNERLALYGRAGELAKECDAVVAVMGINRTIEREGKDRDEITLPADQQEFLQELVKVNPNIILVLVAGSSLSLNWEQENLPAIVNAWYPGEKGGTAVAEVLFGQYNPAGRLPLTFYRSMSDLPPFNDYDITKRTYKYFEKEVLYPFGYGLSYTQFKYSGLNVEDKGENVDVTFTLENTGECDGDEVAQVYTRLPEYEGKAPLKELRGFKRVHLKRGESKEVTIHLRREDLRYWSESNKQFVVPQGLPTVMVGASSADIRLEK